MSAERSRMDCVVLAWMYSLLRTTEARDCQTLNCSIEPRNWVECYFLRTTIYCERLPNIRNSADLFPASCMLINFESRWARRFEICN